MISYDAKLKIGEILYNRTLENKVLDIYDIKKIILILNSDDKITDYLKKISNEHHLNSLAGYSLKEKKMYIDLKEFKKDNIDLLNKNALILDAIFHEIFHTYQHKYINNNDDMKSKLFKACFDFTVFKSKEERYKDSLSYNAIRKSAYEVIYKDLYLSFPTERFAIYDANKLVNDILKIVYNSKADKIVDNNNINTFNTLNKNIVCDNKLYYPLKTFILLHDNILIYEPIGKYVDDENLTLEEKFKYGFSLSKKEYKKFILEHF